MVSRTTKSVSTTTTELPTTPRTRKLSFRENNSIPYQEMLHYLETSNERMLQYISKAHTISILTEKEMHEMTAHSRATFDYHFDNFSPN